MEDLQTELLFCAEVFSNRPNEENGKEITLPFLYVFMQFLIIDLVSTNAFMVRFLKRKSV